MGGVSVPGSRSRSNGSTSCHGRGPATSQVTPSLLASRRSSQRNEHGAKNSNESADNGARMSAQLNPRRRERSRGPGWERLELDTAAEPVAVRNRHVPGESNAASAGGVQQNTRSNVQRRVGPEPIPIAGLDAEAQRIGSAHRDAPAQGRMLALIDHGAELPLDHPGRRSHRRGEPVAERELRDEKRVAPARRANTEAELRRCGARQEREGDDDQYGPASHAMASGRDNGLELSHTRLPSTRSRWIHDDSWFDRAFL